MKKATLTETKNNLSALIDQVRHGESLLILDRGVPVARVESVARSVPSAGGRLARLERLGLVIRASGELRPARILEEAPPLPEGGASALAALVAERESGR